MAARRILQLGDPLLRLRSAPARIEEIGGVLADLRDTLHEFRRAHGFGRGISAVQIGELTRVIHIEMDGAAYSLVNPEVVALSGKTFELWDDCFSFPDLMVRVRRSLEIRLRYTGEHGEPHELTANGALSELLQHEMDHLDGILAIDRAVDRNSLCTREEWKRRYGGANSPNMASPHPFDPRS